MSTHEITAKVQELRELRRLADELNAEIEAIQDSIKAEMVAREVDELSGNDYKISWKLVNTRRFDGKAFKSAHRDLYDQFLCESATRRFTLA